MKTVKSAVRTWLASVSVLVLVSLLVPVCAMAQAQPLSTVPGVPNVVNPNENDFQRQTHFLTFIGSYIPESAASARAYYAAIDPNNTKPTFPQWLVNAGFISNVSQWHPSGPQIIACDLPGCDLPSHTNGVLTYGPNVINTDSHAIVLNAADLGFVRNQFIRCKPSCTAANPIIYTYLENYPVAPFASQASGGDSGFPTNSGYPSQADAAKAINSAITRPLGQIDGVSPCVDATKCIERIADVAFEWAPPATNPTSSTRYGQQYAYIFFHDANGITESTNFPDSLVNNARILDFKAANGTYLFVQQGDKFAPNLDAVGFKQHPGVCLICHGGTPQNLTSTGAYPRQGNIDGFRFLPLDIRNLLFTSDSGSERTSRLNQEPSIKRYNRVVLITARGGAGVDDQGVFRPPHIAEVIRGWYAGYPGDTTMSSPTQNSNFIPKGWLEPVHGGTAPAGSEDVYLHVVGPSCRTCHFNRELSLDFGTAASFRQESDLQQLSLIAACKQNNPDPNAKFMPLALLTFVRAWQTQNGAQVLPSADNFTVDHAVDKLAAYFGYGSVAGYCATNP